MTNAVAVQFEVHFKNQAKGRKTVQRGAAPPPLPPDQGRVPRISRLMAMAIRIDEMIRRGDIRDYAEAARLAHMTRARMSQIMNLINLAPEIQEALLFLPPTLRGDDAVTERDVRQVAAQMEWTCQRVLGRGLTNPLFELP